MIILIAGASYAKNNSVYLKRPNSRIAHFTSCFFTAIVRIRVSVWVSVVSINAT